jgi:mono/diheme cytochrome c family protein
MFDLVGVIVLVLLIAGFGWLALRARRAKQALVKWGGLGVSSLLAVVCCVALVVALVGFYKLTYPPYHYAVSDLKVAGTPEQLARGEKFMSFCAACHGPSGKPPLAGQNFSEGGPPVGTLYASNLTPAGELKDWSDGEIIRAIREGVHRSGRPLIVMPSEYLRNLSDADVQAVVAALRAQPAASTASPPTKVNVVGALFVGAGMLHTTAQKPITAAIVAPAEGTSADYGQYLVSFLACRLCHGENLTGGTAGKKFPPAGPDLTHLGSRWSEADFIRTLRTGVDPDQHTLNPEAMPWKMYSGFASDDDLKAIHAYLASRQ